MQFDPKPSGSNPGPTGFDIGEPKEFAFDYDNKHFSLWMHSRGSIGPAATHGFYEREFLEYVRRAYPTQKTIIEVGAHCGNHVTFWTSFLEYKEVHAFEPNYESFPLLERNVGHLPGVHLYPKGVWSHEAQGTIFRYQVEPGCTSVSPIEGGDNEVDLVAIDSLGLKDVTMIKMDCEGPELQALQGAEETIRRDRPVLFVEISPQGNEHFPPQFDEIEKLLTGWGYHLQHRWYEHIMMEWTP